MAVEQVKAAGPAMQTSSERVLSEGLKWAEQAASYSAGVLLRWYGRGQVKYESSWHKAKHPWIGRMRIQRDCAFIKWVKVLEFAPQVESLCLHITHNLQCCYFLLAEPHICISVKAKYEASASPSDKQIGKSKKKKLKSENKSTHYLI